jgi:hypothetical protein
MSTQEIHNTFPIDRSLLKDFEGAVVPDYPLSTPTEFAGTRFSTGALQGDASGTSMPTYRSVHEDYLEGVINRPSRHEPNNAFGVLRNRLSAAAISTIASFYFDCCKLSTEWPQTGLSIKNRKIVSRIARYFEASSVVVSHRLRKNRESLRAAALFAPSGTQMAWAELLEEDDER